MTEIFNILLIEDNSNEVLLIKNALTQGKILHELHIVENGSDALAFLYRKEPYSFVTQPDLILLDLNLPELDGWEVLEKTKSDPNLRRIPVVILTNSMTDLQISKAYDMHVNGYIIKPVSYDKFTEIIQKTCNFWLNIVALPKKD